MIAEGIEPVGTYRFPVMRPTRLRRVPRRLMWSLGLAELWWDESSPAVAAGQARSQSLAPEREKNSARV